MKNYCSAFELLTDDEAEVALLTKRSELMNNIRDKFIELKLTQKEASKIMKVTQPRVSDLCNGRMSGFSLDRLFLMSHRINLAN